MSEHLEQAALIVWTQLKGHPYNLIFAIPNGGHRHPRTATFLKAEGVKPGVPDLMLPVACGGYHGLFIEMKFGRNPPTKEQKEKLAALQEQGYAAHVCYGWEAAREVIEDYLGK